MNADAIARRGSTTPPKPWPRPAGMPHYGVSDGLVIDAYACRVHSSLWGRSRPRRRNRWCPATPCAGPPGAKIAPKLFHTPLRSTAVDRSTPLVTCGCAGAFHIITSILQFYDSGCRGFGPRHSPSQGSRSTAVSRVLTPAAGCSRASPWCRNGAGLHRPRQRSASAGLPGPAWTSPVARVLSPARALGPRRSARTRRGPRCQGRTPGRGARGPRR